MKPAYWTFVKQSRICNAMRTRAVHRSYRRQLCSEENSCTVQNTEIHHWKSLTLTARSQSKGPFSWHSKSPQFKLWISLLGHFHWSINLGVMSARISYLAQIQIVLVDKFSIDHLDFILKSPAWVFLILGFLFSKRKYFIHSTLDFRTYPFFNQVPDKVDIM